MATAVLACLAGAPSAQAAGTTDPCKLFAAAEVGAYLGATVGAGRGATGGGSCQWVDKDYEVQAIVTIVAPEKFEEPSLVKGFKRLPALGKKAWVAPNAGWRAGALLDGSAVLVNLDSKKMNEAATVAFLREAVKRHSK